mmetsp:Transcript_55643/g.118342  ORF Transcript_55643/g.118342 Transcript_55643/m.118342 type:complete len:109 (-) Transcript_55643:233-559(-)
MGMRQGRSCSVLDPFAVRSVHRRPWRVLLVAIAGPGRHHPPRCWPWYIVLLVNVASAVLLVAVSGTGESTSSSSAPASVHHPHDFLTGYSTSSSSSSASAPNIALLVV